MVFPYGNLGSHSCEEVPASQTPRRNMTVNDLIRLTNETPDTIQKEAAGNVLMRMQLSSCTDADDLFINLPCGDRGQVQK